MVTVPVPPGILEILGRLQNLITLTLHFHKDTAVDEETDTDGAFSCLLDLSVKDVALLDHVTKHLVSNGCFPSRSLNIECIMTPDSDEIALFLLEVLPKFELSFNQFSLRIPPVHLEVSSIRCYHILPWKYSK